MEGYLFGWWRRRGRKWIHLWYILLSAGNLPIDESTFFVGGLRIKNYFIKNCCLLRLKMSEGIYYLKYSKKKCHHDHRSQNFSSCYQPYSSSPSSPCVPNNPQHHPQSSSTRSVKESARHSLKLAPNRSSWMEYVAVSVGSQDFIGIFVLPVRM